MAQEFIKASEMITMLQAAIDKVGDLNVIFIAPYAGVVDTAFEVLTGDDYFNDGSTWGGDDACVGRIVIDAWG